MDHGLQGGVLLKCKIPKILFLATTQSTQPSASNRIAELSAGQQMCAAPAEATPPAGAYYAPAGLGQGCDASVNQTWRSVTFHYNINFIRSATLVLFLLCFSTSS